MASTTKQNERVLLPTTFGSFQTEVLSAFGVALQSHYTDVLRAAVPEALARLTERFEDQEREAMHASRR